MKVWNTKTTPKRVAYTLLLLSIMSCSTPKNIAYFQGLENLEEVTITNKQEIRYKPQDIISIVVVASDPETAIPFNSNAPMNTSKEGTLNSTSPEASRYLLDANGMIEFPVIGQLKVSGLTSYGVKEMIKEKLKLYIKNPIVSVKLENFKVTILGEVNSPGAILIDNERVTLIEALGLAGDLSIQGKRTNVTVIRKEDNKQVVHKVDLTSKNMFNSPVYHLAQNDIVYVEPSTSRKKVSRDNEWSRILASTSSILGIIISIILLTR